LSITMRMTMNYEMLAPAQPEQVFPLLCPVRECDGLPRSQTHW
jgi:hypothetical protein